LNYMGTGAIVTMLAENPCQYLVVEIIKKNMGTEKMLARIPCQYFIQGKSAS